MQKMIKFDVTTENVKEHNPNWPHILHHPHKILTIEGFLEKNFLGLEKTNSLFSLISHQPDIAKICLYAKDPYEVKYQLLINKRGSTGLKNFNDSKAFIEYSNNMNGWYLRKYWRIQSR